MPLQRLPEARLTAMSTLYLPPVAEALIDPEMMSALGIAAADIEKRW